MFAEVKDGSKVEDTRMRSWRWLFGLFLLWAACLSPCLGQEKGKKQAEDDVEVFSTAELLGGAKWSYSVSHWKKGRLLVSLFRVVPAGKDPLPVAMTVSRLTTGGAGAVSGTQSNEDIDILIPAGNDTYCRYKFKEGKHEFRPEFQKKKYDLDEGTLFVIDHGAKPIKVEQIKVDLGKLFDAKGELTRKDLAAALKQLRADKPAIEALLKQIEAKQ
jgi:hypothetical protein